MSLLIVNEAEMQAFIDEIDRQKPKGADAFYFQINTRQKYGGSTNQVLFRKVVPLKRLVDELHQATPFRGFYFEGEPVIHESLACYMTPEPRDIEAAGKYVCSSFIMKQENQDFRIPSIFYSECQKHPVERRILDIDVDDKSKFEVVMARLDDIGVKPHFVIETHGGYHLLCYDCSAPHSKAIYEMSQKIGSIDLLKNSMVPIPGTLQGGFEVKWIR